MRTAEEGGLWALMVWMSLGSAGAILSLVLPGELAYFGWALAVLAAIVVGANCAFRLLEARASLKEPSSKPAPTPPSVAQSLRDAGVEEEWVREYVEKPLGVDAQSLISVPNPDGSKAYYARERRRDGGWSVRRVESPCSDSVKHLRQEVARSRQSQTVIYRPPRMHLHRRPLRYNPPLRKEPEDDPWYRRKDPE